jgi:beta-galactosidase/beta-glucuronidase
MRKIIAIIFVVVLLFGCKKKELPEYFVQGVSRPVISLNGNWKINMQPEGDFHKNDHFEEWNDIQVPGECMMQGFAIKHDVPFVYKKSILIPADYKNRKILLQFDGVYSYARVWVNGK